MTMQRSRILKSLVLELAVSGSALAQCQYSVQTYPPFDCGFWGFGIPVGQGLNNLGGWAGYRLKCTPGTGSLPIYCPPGGAPQQLPMPPGAGPKGAWAYGVNDAGVVAGVSYEGLNGVPEKGAVWWPDGSVTIIPPASGTYSQAYGINNSNMVVGESGGLPYVWQNGVTMSIPSPGLGSGYAWRISDAGYVTGTFGNQNQDARAFRWKNGALDLLEPVSGHPVSVGRAVNDLGWVVGSSRTPPIGGGNSIQTPTLWIGNRGVALPLPEGYTTGAAGKVNGTGVISGSCSAAETGLPTIEILWINGAVLKLNNLLVPGSQSVGSVVAINNAGQILSGGSAKLLTPIGASPADLNGDCAVNGADLALILSEWGPVLQPGSACDINGDDTVNGADLGLLLGAWAP